MKKKRFYNNKKRNIKWTEKQTGRKISFADKYIEAGSGSDKFDAKRPKQKKKRITKEKSARLFKNITVIIACFLIISVGYSAMDLYIDRNAMPQTQESTGESASFSDVNLMLKAMAVESISLDDSVMLDSAIKSAEDEGYSSITFDLKRDDGTIGYNSNLATIKAYGAISSPANQLEKSIAKLNQANIVALSDLDTAIKSGKSVYRDSDGNAYLDPNNDTTYNYIKSIVEEAKAMGVTVFLLDNTTLPSEIEGEYNDGFEKLTKMLYAQFGEDIKFIEAVDVTINDYNISNEDVTDENGDTVYNTTSSSSDSEEFTTGYGDSSEIDGEETSATKKREPLTDEDGDFVYGNDGLPVYSTEESSTSQLTTQSSNSLEKQIENKISEKSSNNKMYYISTNNAEKVKKILDNKKITNYIIKSIN